MRRLNDAVVMITGAARGLGRELRGDVTVNDVAPGVIRNEATHRQVPGELLDMRVAQNAIKRHGTAADMYRAIRFLGSDDADWITGQVLSPNGGMPCMRP